MEDRSKGPEKMGSKSSQGLENPDHTIHKKYHSENLPGPFMSISVHHFFSILKTKTVALKLTVQEKQ